MNLAGIKVAHDIADFEEGSEQILVLKDTHVLEDQGNIHQN